MARRSFSQLQSQAGADSAYNHFKGAAAGEDDLDDIEAMMGEDFGFGFDPDEGDPNKPPRVPDAPREVLEERTCNAVTFEFNPHNQFLTSLSLQAIAIELVANPGDPFQAYNVIKKGCLTQEIPDPQTATRAVFGELSAGATFYFRLVARNPKGTALGRSTVAITTLEWAPARGDLSSFLWAHPVVDIEKKRRMSLKGTQKPKRDYVWVVLDGQLLSWADSVDGKEMGRVLMTEVKCVLSEEGKGDSTRIVVQDVKGREFNFEAESRNPNVSSVDLCRTWLTRLRQTLAMSPSDFGKSTNTVLLM